MTTLKHSITLLQHFMVDSNHIVHGRKSQMKIKLDSVICAKIEAGKIDELRLLLEDKTKLNPNEKEKAKELIETQIVGFFLKAATNEFQRLKVNQRWRNMKLRARRTHRKRWEKKSDTYHRVIVFKKSL